MSRRLRLVLPAVWRTRNPVARALVPLGWLYAGLARARRAAYRLGLFRVIELGRPVVVVGGITVGGSGKTPLVMHVARLLGDRGFRPGIVSRGYGGRHARGPLIVNSDTPASACGDEPAMMARKLDLPVVVDRDRPRGAATLIDRLGCDVVVSDDGLQHYAMDRQVEIAVVSGFGNGYCLPAGPLREPVARLDEVDLVVCNGPEPGQGQYRMALGLAELIRLDGGDKRPMNAWSGRRVHAVAGTGNPDAFFRSLSASALQTEAHPFPDHHDYQRRDFEAMNDAPIVMTEKDAVKCAHLPLEDAWYAPATITLSRGFDEKLIELLRP